MSGLDHVKGTLYPIDTCGDTEGMACAFLKDLKVRRNKTYDSCLEQLTDEFMDDYVVIQDQLFSMNKEEVKDQLIMKQHMGTHGFYTFDVKFYNSVDHLTSALNEAFVEMQEKNK